MAITVITSLPQLNSLTTNPNQVSIIDFHALWCGPCKVIAPVFAKLATTYEPRVTFFKCDVDAAKDVAAHFRVSAMPTFVILKGSQKVDEMKGAQPAALDALIKKHAPAAAATGASGSGSSSESLPVLNSLIDTRQLSCLNESDDHTVRDLIKGGGDKWLESDCDEQLLLHIPMNQSVRIRAIRLSTLPSFFAQAPKTLRLFVNNPTLGFDDAESLEPAQEVEVSEKQARGEESIQLRFVRFQSVATLSIFVSANQGGEDVTRIDRLEVFGTAIEDGWDVTKLRKTDDD